MAYRHYMLDTNTCSFIIRERPPLVLARLQDVVQEGHHVCISAISYAELLFGAHSRRASPRMPGIVAEFVARLDNIAPWHQNAAQQAALLKRALDDSGMPIGPNDLLIAGHALANHCVLVSDNVREFSRVEGVALENWVAR
jgi:tRNA(fMet)-specific endonuclease VapC